jgi:hypothetical protein
MTAVLALVAAFVGVGPAAAAEPPPGPLVPYYAPPFADDCVVHRFAEGEVPNLAAYPDDPLCVDYAKRDITVADGGALRFLVAEPARVALAVGKCRYWQQDHWSVQLVRGQLPLIRWDGSYWFDLGTGQAGARLTGLTIAGQPATLVQAAALMTLLSPQLAAYFLAYAQGGDGASFAAGFPFDPLCPR